MKFTNNLIHWYSENKRNFPWRKTNDPYTIWLSEIILQQTQIKQGFPYFLKFINKFPTVFDMANASETDILNLWQGLGYYSRARNLHVTAKYIVNERNGEFPNTHRELLKLKGVGDYTASAIASICFGENTAVVDGNVYRVLSRFFGIKTPINSTEGKKTFKQLAQKLIDKKNPAEFNQAIMEFGAIQCKPKSPNCSICPFITDCYAFKNRFINVLPVKIKKSKIKNKVFNFLVFISNNNETLLEQRLHKGIWYKLYQFPLIETTKQVSRKYIEKSDVFKEFTPHNYSIEKANKTPIIHKLSHQHLHTTFWIVKVDRIDSSKKININDINQYPIPILIDKFIKSFAF